MNEIVVRIKYDPEVVPETDILNTIDDVADDLTALWGRRSIQFEVEEQDA